MVTQKYTATLVIIKVIVRKLYTFVAGTDGHTDVNTETVIVPLWSFRGPINEQPLYNWYPRNDSPTKPTVK